MVLVADGIAVPPELGGNAGVGGVLEHAAHLAILDLVGDLGAELEVEPLVVDAPAPVQFHIDAVVGVGDQVVELPAARLQVDVGHAHDGDAVPAVGTHGPTRGFGRGIAHDLAELLGRLPRGEVAAEDAFTDDGDPLGRHPFVIPAKGAQPAGNGGVGGQVDDVGTVAKGPKLLWGEETGTGITGFGAKHPVQLDGMAARLVDLQSELGWPQDDGGHTAGALVGAEQSNRLLADARRVTRQVHGQDRLPTLATLVAPEGVGEGTLLHFAPFPVYGRGLDPTTRLDDRLLDKGPFGTGKGLVLLPESQRRGGDHDPRCGP